MKEVIIMLAILVIALAWEISRKIKQSKKLKEYLRKEQLREKTVRGLRENGNINMARK